MGRPTTGRGGVLANTLHSSQSWYITFKSLRKSSCQDPASFSNAISFSQVGEQTVDVASVRPCVVLCFPIDVALQHRPFQLAYCFCHLGYSNAQMWYD